MHSIALFLSVLVAFAEARFGQEQIPVAAVQALKEGAPGVAATLAGGLISTILAAANPCAKLQFADKIIAELGTSADVIKAAIGLVSAEQNFNEFVVSIPNICGDPSLPVTAQLRGIVPLVDPAVVGSGLENANSAKSAKTPFSATGMSVAQVMAAHGFSNFTAKDLNGDIVRISAAVAPHAPPTNTIKSAAVIETPDCNPPPPDCNPPPPPPPPVECDSAPTTMVTMVAPAASTPASSSGGVQKSTIAGLDFGICVPTVKFEAGLNGRKNTEFTFQAIDPIVNKGQQEALNPNIIFNRICDQLTNVCKANAAAKAACQAAKTSIGGLGTRDVTTADAWNTALGFKGTGTNPDNAPQPGLIGHS